MFGLNSFLMALRNLTHEITRTANLFKTANDSLESRLTIDASIDDDLPALPAPTAENGHKRLSRTRC
jgi:hypothetical protein